MIAEELQDNTIELEGNELRTVELGHTDWQETTCLYVPSIGLAVAGDGAFNGTHLWLAGSTTLGSNIWAVGREGHADNTTRESDDASTW